VSAAACGAICNGIAYQFGTELLRQCGNSGRDGVPEVELDGPCSLRYSAA